METYFGDLGGNLLWKYWEKDQIVHYLQDPLVLVSYGGTVESKCIWDGCSCKVHDNNIPYCWVCWDSREHHKSTTNLDELRKTQHKITVDRRIMKDFLPWIQEFTADFEPCLDELLYAWTGDTVALRGDYAIPCGPNGRLLGQYVLFKQLQYFFDTSEHSSCSLYIYEYP